jgi:hypothetical protein
VSASHAPSHAPAGPAPPRRSPLNVGVK